MATPEDLDTGRIKEWQSIVTLIVFILTNLAILFPFKIPIPIPRSVWHFCSNRLAAWRVIPTRKHVSATQGEYERSYVLLHFPVHLVTAPLIADLFLLAIGAIGRQEVHDGTIGTANIVPYDIMLFFLSLAYIAISLDASGLIRFLAYKVLLWGGDAGHRLFFYLYIFFFSVGSFIGNDPIILSGTAFLSYMTRVSANIDQPTAWIYTQFSIANIASAILVSSNPANLVLSGAFNIKFLHYTANIIVPVLFTVIIIFPFLLYIVFHDETLIPTSIRMHDLPEGAREKPPVNPNIPYARGMAEQMENEESNSEEEDLSLVEIMHPFVDRRSAIFGASLMAATLIAILALNAATQGSKEHPVFWVTLPAAAIMLAWDLTFGWLNRKETREVARIGREEAERARMRRYVEREMRNEKMTNDLALQKLEPNSIHLPTSEKQASQAQDESADEKQNEAKAQDLYELRLNARVDEELARLQDHGPATLVSKIAGTWQWLRETFPTATAVLALLPFALLPFAFCMFVLVQALVTKGWVPVFAHGWDAWVKKTGTVGSIGGMAFLATVLSNFAGTNIGTTILLSRVIQAWQAIHDLNGQPISDRTFWGTIYSMALGVNYGAFSVAFSASLAGLLWRDILARKKIHVGRLQFARVNLPIIALAMTVGCVALVIEIYVIRTDAPYNLK